MEEPKITFKILEKVSTPEELSDAAKLRELVFVKEQEIPAELEFDEYDWKATHIIMYYENTAIGTARWFCREDDNNWYVGRFAIVKEYRGKSFGKRLMEEIVKILKEKGGISKLYLHAQVQAIPFYEKSGWMKFGEKYVEDGIDHYSMYLTLSE